MDIAPEREAGVEYMVTIPCRDGTLAIAMGERPAPEGALCLEATGQVQDVAMGSGYDDWRWGGRPPRRP